MQLKFYGACQEVTGSNYLLEIGETKILVDCGIWQGQKFTEAKNYEPFPYDPKEINYLFLTHAHLDHCGRIPKLYHDGFRGQIICTEPTRDFAQLMLTDSYHVLAEEARREKRPPLYELADVQNCLRLFQPIKLKEKITLTPQISFSLHDAGHILGSAFLEIWAEGKKIIFSGDLGNSPAPILNNTEFIKEADYLIMESTYGSRTHEDTRERLLLLSSAIYETIHLKGVLMIPAFALERTQEILYELNKLIESKEIPRLPVFVDSPLAIKATQIFKKYKDTFDPEAQEILKIGDRDIFNFPGLRFTPTSQESKQIYDVRPPKIIIAGSGMCQGGRIGFHLARYLPEFRNQLLIIGYQVKGSLGRQLLEKQKNVIIDGRPIQVQAKIRAIGAYSAHADQPKLLNWVGQISQLKPRQIFITHGEPLEAAALAQALAKQFNIPTAIPQTNQQFNI